MSEPELAYMTGNDDFDLPRWQTRTSHDSISSSAQPASNYYSSVPPPPPLSSHRISQTAHQSSAASSRQPRITQIVEEDTQFGVSSLPYSTNVLSRSASMGTSSANIRRRHHLPDDLEGAPDSAHKQPNYTGSTSIYPPSVPFQVQTLSAPNSDPMNSTPVSTSPYQDMYYNASPTHPPKRSQTQHDPGTSSQPARSPMRHGNLSNPSLLDPYASQQQSQYSPTGYTYPDQQRAYAPSDNSAYTPQPSLQTSFPHGGPSVSPQPQSATSPTHLATHRSTRQASSVPNTPLSFAHPMQQEVPTHYYLQDPQPMMVEVPQKRRPSGFRRVRDHNDLRPITNRMPTGRRMDPQGNYLTPIRQLTTHIVDTFRVCNPQFRYESTHNPRRVLTKPSKPAHNDGYDNEDYDYILYVNDWLGTDEGHKYLILDILGQGTFGQVVKCQNMKTHEVVAVKVVKNKPAYFNQSMMEVTILELLNSQCDPNDEHHILRLHDSFIHRSHLCLVFELLSSNLYELIKQNQFQGLSTQLVKVFTAQLLDSLTVLKEARLIHCDLKPENILLKSLQSPQIKVIDFGSACHERQTVYTYIQSRFYRSPEVLLGIQYNASIDMWSLGCIAVELFLGLPLFPGTSEYNQITRIIEMLGMPPQYMTDMGKQTSHFFDSYVDAYGHKKYRLKSIEQYSRERNTNEQPGKQYFKATTLPDIINQAPMPNFKSSRHGNEVEKELNNRASFIDFCQGLLNLNPIERWTPQQARQHPFITGDKFTKPWSPSSQPNNPQPSSTQLADPKRPYGGLVPSQPKGTRAYQDAASYNQHLAQHQAYTAQAQAASQANSLYRNPYITPQTSQQSGVSGVTTAYTNTQDKNNPGFPHPLNLNTSSQQYPNQQSSGFPVTQTNPNPPPNSYYPNATTRARANTINQMDGVPPALARLQHMNQDVIAGRNALTPVLKRDDPIREWERRQAGKVAAAQPYPQLEYLHQQAELAAAQGLTNWGGQNRYTGPGTAPQHSSNLAHNFHVPQTAAAMVVDEDRKDVVMSSVRTAAQGDSSNTVYGTTISAVTNPNQAYGSNATAGSRYPAFSQSQQQSPTFDSIDRRTDIGTLYVPMQADQFASYNGPPNSAGSQPGPARHTVLPGQTMPASFYPGGVVAAGVGGTSVGAQQAQRNLFDPTVSQTSGLKDPRRGNNADIWPR